MTPAQLDELERYLDARDAETYHHAPFIAHANHGDENLRASTLRELLALGRASLAESMTGRPARVGELKVGHSVLVLAARSAQPVHVIGMKGFVDRVIYEGEPNEYLSVNLGTERWAFHPDELEKLP